MSLELLFTTERVGYDTMGARTITPQTSMSLKRMISLIHYGLESRDQATEDAAESALSFAALNLRRRMLLVPGELQSRVNLLNDSYHAKVKDE
jgi:hypothetical protein